MLALIDGDLFAHVACASRRNGVPPPAEETLVQISDPKERHEFSVEQDTKFLMRCWEDLSNTIERALEAVYADDYLMAVKHSANFRMDLHPLYKFTRHSDPNKMNRFVPMLRKVMVQHGMAIYSEGREADDFIRMWSEQAKAAQEDFVVITEDKDLRCIAGTHYNPRTKMLTTVDEFSATKLFYLQMLIGDQVDSIPGVKGIGPVKAEQLLRSARTEEEMQEIVAFVYRDIMGDDWFNLMLSNGKMLHLQRHEHDWFACSHWPVVQALRSLPPDPVEIKAEVKSAPPPASPAPLQQKPLLAPLPRLTGTPPKSPQLASPCLLGGKKPPSPIPPPSLKNALPVGAPAHAGSTPNKGAKIGKSVPFTGTFNLNTKKP